MTRSLTMEMFSRVRCNQRTAILFLFALLISLPTQAQYVRGPRGGCYTVTKSGTKRYVDRSMCDGKGASEKSSPPSSKKYITGPRGGCYYVTASGRKQYVDHSLCQ
jgi:hypothetical protein